MFTWHDTPWMWLSMIVFWSLFVFFFYCVLKGSKNSESPPAQSKPRATEILEERFARGDISAEAFRDSRDTLETTGAPNGQRP